MAETLTASVRLCGDLFSSCVCSLLVEHDGPHVCECDGSWTCEGEIVRYPEGRTLGEAIAAVLGVEDDG